MMRIVVSVALAMLVFQTSRAATVTFNGGVEYQAIDGFGVNANHRSWNNDELKPVLDALIDQAGMTLFRVVYDDTNWEANNDNSDPNVMNWSYYAPLYSNAEFTKLWNLIAYLNSKGITTNGVIFNFMGPGPSWMGGGTLTTGKEAEWAEMITSLLVWARYTNGLQFNLVAPDNEPDISNEGITITSANQYVTALRALAQKLDANGLSNLRLVGPDRAGGGTAYMPEMMADPVVMAKVAHFGVHSYSDGGSGSSGVYAYLQASAYPDRTFWVTEFNVWCSTCDSGTRGTYDWAYCKGTADYLLNHLANNASGGIVWEGYDSYYLHPPTAWSFWGLLSVDNQNAAVKTYTPRKNFYTMAQISKFIRPGAQRIGVSGSVSSLSPLLAFKHEGLGQITIVGINTSGSAATLSGALASLPAVPHLDLYYTSATANLANGGSVAVNNGTFSATIPADCVFTLTGSSGVNVALSNPVNGAQFTAPATIPLAATATTAAGSIALVWFYNGVTPLGESTLAPYGFTWNNVPMGNYALTAVAGDTFGNIGTSAVVNVTVVGPLTQIGVTPANATVAPGGKQQFTATGIYSDGTAQNLTSQATWASSRTAVATINSSGLATGVTAGITTISATLGSVSGNTTLTIQPPPLAITTTSLPSGAVSTTYTTTLAASGGIAPYAWSLAGGTLPPGLTLSSTGVITGTPTTTGTSSFTVRAADSSISAQTATRLLSLTINSAGTSGLIGNTTEGTLTDNLWYNGAWINAGRFQAGSNMMVSTIRAKVAAIPGKYKCAIYSDGSSRPSRLLGSTAEVSNPASGWQSFPLTSSVALTKGSYYWLAIWSGDANARVYYSGNNGTLRWGPYNYGTWPDPVSTTGGGSLNYCIYGTGTGATLANITVAPANPNMLAGATQQFMATGTYSDSSTQNITNQATWRSSNTGVATINASGLATAVAVGTTTISAALAGVTNSTVLTVKTPTTLTSIAVTPANTAILAGALQPFTVTGTYSDSSTQDITSQVTWMSSSTGVATISASGLATAVAAGTTTISAALAGVNNSTVLTVKTPAALTSIAVTPPNPTNLVGTTRQFMATGTYSDGTAQNLTSQATWASSRTAVATINSSGLATGVTAGITTISATLGSVSGNTTLTIQPPPLAITTTSLPSGAVSTAYTTTLAASGGIAPYAWSLAGGTLPPGLTLSSTGVITGTPTTTGTSSFTVRAADASIPAQTATGLLSLTINSVGTGGLIGNTTEGTLTDNLWYNGAWINAGRFQAGSNMMVSTIRAKVAAIPGQYKCAIYSDGSSRPSRLLGSTAEVSNPASGWQSFPLTSSVALTKGSYYWLAIWSGDANARVYYSGNNGTLRWGLYNYGTWPDPLSTTGGGSFNYCIYARQ